MREFDYSEKREREINRELLIFLFIFELFIASLSLYLGLLVFHISTFKCLVITGILIVYTGIKFSLIIFLVNRSTHKMKVLVYDDRLVRKRGKRHDGIMWGSITKIKTLQDYNGVLKNITLYLEKPKRMIPLGGFENMEDLSELIKERISDEVIILEKHLSKYLDNPIFGSLVMVIPAFILMCVVTSLGEKSTEIFFAGFFMLNGVLLLIPRESDPLENKRLEKILGLIVFILGFFMLIVFLF